jgi:glycosyltransferase involved in cell wall biosynthesis
VYRRAALLLQTSDAEGFGLPLIEAMACGCPVVASDIPVLREVGGTATSYCSVADVQGWVNTIGKLLAERESHTHAWMVRRETAVHRAERFTWAENACATTEVYRTVIQRIAAQGTA